jgi:vacuolar-type H+-ATPase subunit I/STV1
VPETIKASAGQSGLELGTVDKQHPVQLGLTAFTLLAGIIAFAAGLVVRLHLAATVLGLASLVVGLCVQMISTTRLQRILLMAGVVPAFVGICLGLAHGGFG